MNTPEAGPEHAGWGRGPGPTITVTLGRLERRSGYAHLEITGRLALALEVKAEELLARK